MSTKKITQLQTATDITASDFIQVVDIEDGGMAPSGTNKKISAQTLGNYLPVISTGSTTYRSLKDRFADTVNVKDFGAKGDGVTDDTAAIQAAITYCVSNKKPVLSFSGGTYIISASINVDNANNFTICGDYSNNVSSDNPITGGYTLYLKNSADSHIFNVSNSTGISIRGISIYGNANNQSLAAIMQKHGIALTSCTTVSISDVYMYKIAGAGIAGVTQSNGINVESCVIRNTGSFCIDFSNCPDSIVSNCEVLFGGVYGWRILNTHSGCIQIGDTTIVSNCQIYQGVGNNVNFTGKQSQLIGSRLDGPTRANVRTSVGTFSNRIIDNILFDSGVYKTDDTSNTEADKAGIYLAGTQNKVINCFVGAFTKSYGTESWLGRQGTGIHINGQFCEVNGVTVRSCQFDGININSKNNKVFNNIVEFCGPSGINVGSTEATVAGNVLYENGKTSDDNSNGIDVISDDNRIYKNEFIGTGINNNYTLTSNLSGGDSSANLNSVTGITVGDVLFVFLNDTVKNFIPVTVQSITGNTVNFGYAIRGSGVLANSGNSVRSFVQWVGIKLRPGADNNKLGLNVTSDVVFGYKVDSGSGNTDASSITI